MANDLLRSQRRGLSWLGEFKPRPIHIEGEQAMKKLTRYIGLDQHMLSIVVGVADYGRSEPKRFGEIPSSPEAMRKLAAKLGKDGHPLSFCYEAGPCGYGLYHQLQRLGHECVVVAPSLTPRKPGERIKTDRRDALSLARQHRAGDLTPVWVPDREQEAIRDLVRCREDMMHTRRKACQRLNSFLLRHDRPYGGRKKWTQAHSRWLETLRFDHPAQQIVFQEYVDQCAQSDTRVKSLEREMSAALEEWSMKLVVRALMALRGVALITAMTVIAELGDLTRFDSPRQLMAFLGLVPAEASSGQRRRQGGITKTGNSHARRVLVEAAWCYRHSARKTAHLQRYAEQASPEVQQIAWKAQKRLCARFRRMMARGKPKNVVCTAIARELLGFIWAIACELGAPQPQAV